MIRHHDDVTVTGGGTLTGSGIENFVGGNFGNEFVFVDGSMVGGNIIGGSGTDTLDFSNYATPRDITLTGLGILDGFKGTDDSIKGIFDNIDELIVSGSGDTLTGMNAAAIWNLTDVGGQYVSGNTLAFENFGILQGGSSTDVFNISGNSVFELNGNAGDDTFAFGDGAILTGNITGGAGVDTLDYSAYNTPITVDLAANTADHVSGVVTGVENLLGGSAADNLIGNEGNNVINGNGGDDILTGGAGDDTYAFTGDWGVDTINEDAAGGSDTLDFSAITTGLDIALDAGLTVTSGINQLNHVGQNLEKLVAGSGDDTFTLTGDQQINLDGGPGNDAFVFEDGATLGNTIKGGSGADTLDFTQYTLGRVVTLTGVGSIDGFAGTSTGTLAAFDNVNNIIGSGTNNDMLVGANTASIWTLDGSNSYTSGNDLDFSGFENLIGGSNVDRFDIIGSQAINLDGGAGDDIFAFASDGMLTGNIEGGAGSDTIDFSAILVARRILLTAYIDDDGFIGFDASFVPTLVGLFTHINTLIGSSDPIDPDILVGVDVDAQWTIIGFFYTYAVNPTLTFASFESLFGGEGEDQFDITGVHDITLAGGAGDDTFKLNDGAQVDVINGQGGFDTLVYYDFNAPIDYDPVSGIATNVPGGLSNIEFITRDFPEPPEPLIPELPELPPVIRDQSVIRIISVTSAQILELKCDSCTAIILQLPTGHQAGFYSKFAGLQVSLTELSVAGLPSYLAEASLPVAKLELRAWRGGQKLISLTDVVVVSFVIPTELIGSQFLIFYWDERAGAWVEITSYRTIEWFNGRLVYRQTARVANTGIYILASIER